MNRICVKNSRRVSEYFGFKVQENENILSNYNCKDFINKYKEYFFTTDTNKFRDFYKKTNLRLCNIYILNNSYKKRCISYHILKKEADIYTFSNFMLEEISFNSLGSSIDSPFREDIYNHDIVTFNFVEDIRIIDRDIIIDGKKLYKLFNNKSEIESQKQLTEVRYELYFEERIEEKVKIIHKKYDSQYKFQDNIKQIYISSFGELYVLYKNGDLYIEDYILCNNHLYAKNILRIWEENIYRCYLIFKDNKIECITLNNWHLKNSFNNRKVLCTDYYLARLYKDELELITKNYETDESHHLWFDNVENISYGDNEFILNIENGGAKISCNTDLCCSK